MVSDWSNSDFHLNSLMIYNGVDHERRFIFYEINEKRSNVVFILKLWNEKWWLNPPLFYKVFENLCWYFFIVKTSKLKILRLYCSPMTLYFVGWRAMIKSFWICPARNNHDIFNCKVVIFIENSFQSCRIKNVKYDGASYVINERFQQHMHQFLNYYILLQQLWKVTKDRYFKFHRFSQ
jgi:hypothetical protein